MATGTIAIQLFEFNNWANESLLEFCQGLDDTQLLATMVGTRGSIKETLVHIVAAQERYVGGLGGPRKGAPVHGMTGWPGFELLLDSARETGAALIAAGAEEDPARECAYRYQGETVTVRAGTFLVQASHHANDHRTQICSILGSIGIEPPEITGWGYAQRDS